MHGLPVPLHVPLLQVSVCVQNKPSLQPQLFESLAVQLFCASLQDSEQSLSPSHPGQGSPVWRLQLPLLLQVSVPLQY